MARKTLVGKVTSNKMAKTVVVEILRRIQHPIYKKFIRKSKKFKADTNNFELAIGEMVKIEETNPISKDKHYKVIAKV